MKKLKNVGNAILIVGIMMLGVTSCTYDTIEYPEIEVPEGVSFNDDIIPIFDASCNGSGCHSTGAWRPDLTAANAYNALIDGDYIDIDDPAGSRLYTKIAPGGSMEQYSTPEYNATILQWIEEGALDN